MNIKTDKKTTRELTAGPQRPMILGLLIVAILGLCACSMPSPTNSGSSSGGGVPNPGGGAPSPGGGVPSPGGGAPSPGGDPGSTASPSGGDAGSEGNQGSPQGDNVEESGGSGDSIEGLDEALDESLEDFDETVLSEGNRNGDSSIDILSPSGTGGGIDSDEPLFEEAGGDGGAEGNASIEQRAAEGAPPGADGSGAEAPSGQASNSSSGQEQAGNEIIPIPDDIDDGQGDDIVLRQIRDAASKERDPILREKLWDEYRRIKNQG